MARTCSSCGAATASSDRFCGDCGASIGEPPSDALQEAARSAGRASSASASVAGFFSGVLERLRAPASKRKLSGGLRWPDSWQSFAGMLALIAFAIFLGWIIRFGENVTSQPGFWIYELFWTMVAVAVALITYFAARRYLARRASGQ